MSHPFIHSSRHAHARLLHYPYCVTFLTVAPRPHTSSCSYHTATAITCTDALSITTIALSLTVSLPLPPYLSRAPHHNHDSVITTPHRPPLWRPCVAFPRLMSRLRALLFITASLSLPSYSSTSSTSITTFSPSHLYLRILCLSLLSQPPLPRLVSQLSFVTVLEHLTDGLNLPHSTHCPGFAEHQKSKNDFP